MLIVYSIESCGYDVCVTIRPFGEDVFVMLERKRIMKNPWPPSLRAQARVFFLVYLSCYLSCLKEREVL